MLLFFIQVKWLNVYTYITMSVYICFHIIGSQWIFSLKEWIWILTRFAVAINYIYCCKKLICVKGKLPWIILQDIVYSLPETSDLKPIPILTLSSSTINSLYIWHPVCTCLLPRLLQTLNRDALSHVSSYVFRKTKLSSCPTQNAFAYFWWMEQPIDWLGVRHY